MKGGGGSKIVVFARLKNYWWHPAHTPFFIVAVYCNYFTNYSVSPNEVNQAIIAWSLEK